MERSRGQGMKHYAIILLLRNRREREKGEKCNNNSFGGEENYKLSVEFNVPSKWKMFKDSIDVNQ